MVDFEFDCTLEVVGGISGLLFQVFGGVPVRTVREMFGWIDLYFGFQKLLEFDRISEYVPTAQE